MVIERLKPEEYPQLKAVAEGFCPDPDNSIVVVARDGQNIVGRTMLVRPFHVEGTWIDESFRGGFALVKLLTRLELEAKNSGLGTMLAYAGEPKVESYLERLGYTKSHLTVWEKKV